MSFANCKLGPPTDGNLGVIILNAFSNVYFQKILSSTGDSLTLDRHPLLAARSFCLFFSNTTFTELLSSVTSIMSSSLLNVWVMCHSSQLQTLSNAFLKSVKLKKRCLLLNIFLLEHDSWRVVELCSFLIRSQSVLLLAVRKRVVDAVLNEFHLYFVRVID